MKKMIIAVMLIAVLTLCGCALAEGSFKVGICNYVDDASLNQIVENIQNQLTAIGAEKGVEFTVDCRNCNADASVMQQIISNFIADQVDLMVGVATPVAMTMQSMTEDNQIPVVFAAVSDPLAVELVDSLEVPGGNITGTSDFLNTSAVLDLIFAANPEADLIGLLYDEAAASDEMRSLKKEIDEEQRRLDARALTRPGRSGGT